MKKKVYLLVLALAMILAAACTKTEEAPAPTVELIYEEMNIEAGSDVRLDYRSDDMASVKFSSSDENVARVSADGYLSAIGEGKCEITAEAGESKAVCRVTVYSKAVKALAFAETKDKLLLGESFALSALTTPTDAKHDVIIYSSSDPDVISVDETGMATANMIGKAVLKAECSGFTAEMEVETYADHAESISLGTYFISLKPGEEKQISLAVDPVGYVPSGFSFAVSDEDIVSVDETGKLTGLKEGLTTLSFSAEGFTENIFISVTEDEPHAPLSEIAKTRFIKLGNNKIGNPASDEVNSADILLVGDLMCLRVQQMKAESGNTYNFNKSFKYVKDIFAKADFVVGNLETCIAYSWPLTIDEKNVDGYPNCNGPATYLDALRYAGFDALVTANNHCCDANLLGILQTNEMLDRYGFAHTGTFSSKEESRFLIADVNGIKVGILSYTEYFNGKHRALSAEEQKLYINEYSKEKVERDVKAAREAGAEFIIVYTHWGTENTHSVSSTQKKHAQEIADAGADLIAGSHPHVLQEADYISAKDGRNVLCIYSLGNFVSSMGSTANNDTIILSIRLERGEDGKIDLAEAGYIAGRVNSRDDYAVTPTIPEYADGKDNASAADRIAGVMGDAIPQMTEY
ncbi:MAG: CapA family protein [Christensenellaceae bacterium]|nr:CapA family protein [Christensenellaceae bacterium]